jgi:hypothetical protein
MVFFFQTQPETSFYGLKKHTFLNQRKNNFILKTELPLLRKFTGITGGKIYVLKSSYKDAAKNFITEDMLCR